MRHDAARCGRWVAATASSRCTPSPRRPPSPTRYGPSPPGSLSAEDFQQIFATSKVYCPRGDNPGFLALHNTQQPVIPMFTTLKELRPYAGKESKYFVITGAEVIDLLPDRLRLRPRHGGRSPDGLRRQGGRADGRLRDAADVRLGVPRPCVADLRSSVRLSACAASGAGPRLSVTPQPSRVSAPRRLSVRRGGPGMPHALQDVHHSTKFMPEDSPGGGSHARSDRREPADPAQGGRVGRRRGPPRARRHHRAERIRGRGLPGPPRVRRDQLPAPRPVHHDGPDGRGGVRAGRAQGHPLAPAPRLRDRHVHHRRHLRSTRTPTAAAAPSATATPSG